ncbi:unnamed protein product [Linum trigynum]|uniref:Uncharacterized protein n=1 Tax=Linum trigynum TaxID=586398 RepID=A0AAV2FBI2_9ROSI
MAWGEISNNMENSNPTHLCHFSKKKKSKSRSKEAIIEEPNPQQPPPFEKPQEDQQGNQVSPRVGIEHLTHAFPENLPKQFKAKLLWLQDLP